LIVIIVPRYNVYRVWKVPMRFDRVIYYLAPAMVGCGPAWANPATASLMAIFSIVSDTVVTAFPKGSHASLPVVVYMYIVYKQWPNHKTCGSGSLLGLSTSGQVLVVFGRRILYTGVDENSRVVWIEYTS